MEESVDGGECTTAEGADGPPDAFGLEVWGREVDWAVAVVGVVAVIGEAADAEEVVPGEVDQMGATAV